MKKIIRISLFVFLIAFVFIGAVACSTGGADVEKIKKDLEESNLRISELEELINGQSQKVSKNDEAIVKLEDAIGDYLEDLESYHEQLEEAKEKLKAIEEKLGDGDDAGLAGLKKEVENLSELLDDLSFTTQDLQGTVTQHTRTLTGVQSKLDELNNKIDDPSRVGAGEVQVNLADKYYLVVGDNFQLFYRSVIRAVDPYQYYIYVTGTKGHTLNRYFEFNPESAGNYSLTISVKDDNGVTLGSDSTTLVVSAKTTTSQKKVLCIGDSLTANGQWIARGVGKFVAAGGTMTTIGTINKTLASSTIGLSKSVTVNYEGRSGWQWSSYLTSYDANTPSPFVVDGKFSFAKYIVKNNLEAFDEVYILMTFNGFTSTDKYDFNSSFLQQARSLVDKIHSDFPNAKITLMGLPLTSTYAGLGAYYQISGSYSDNYGVHMRIHEYDNFLETWSKMDDYKAFLRYVDVKGQFDSEYNMPYENKQVNNTNTLKENVGNAMGMHPSSAGYNQIGDAFFRALMSEW